MMTKIVINACYGGFSLSDEAMHEYARIKGFQIYEDSRYSSLCKLFWTIPEDHPERVLYNQLNNNNKKDWQRINEIHNQYTISNYTDFDRADPALVEVVEKLGSKKASGDCAKLDIEELAKGTLYRITEYDGFESIETKYEIDWKVA